MYRTPEARFAGLPGFAFEPHYAEVDGVRTLLSSRKRCDSVPIHMAGSDGKPSPGQTAQLVSLGTMLFACVAVGLGIGYFADRMLGTQPWLLLIGLGLGIVAAGVNFYRTIKALNGMDQSDGSS